MDDAIKRLYAGAYTGKLTTTLNGRSIQVEVWIMRQGLWARDVQWSLEVTTEGGTKLVHSTDCASPTLRECREQLRLQLEEGYSW